MGEEVDTLALMVEVLSDTDEKSPADPMLDNISRLSVLKTLAGSIYDSIALNTGRSEQRFSRKLLLRDIPGQVFCALLFARLLLPPSPVRGRNYVTLGDDIDSFRVPKPFFAAFLEVLSEKTSFWLWLAKNDLKTDRHLLRSGALELARARSGQGVAQKTPEEIIRDWRVKTGKTYEELARLCGVSVSTVWRIAKGVGKPHPSNLDAVARVVGAEHWGLLISNETTSKKSVK